MIKYIIVFEEASRRVKAIGDDARRVVKPALPTRPWKFLSLALKPFFTWLRSTERLDKPKEPGNSPIGLTEKVVEE
jgi:hypothetical protein